MFKYLEVGKKTFGLYKRLIIYGNYYHFMEGILKNLYKSLSYDYFLLPLHRRFGHPSAGCHNGRQLSV